MSSQQAIPPTETVDIVIDRVFRDARNGEFLRVVYEDDEVVLLRSNLTQNGVHIHRHERRDDFEQQIEADRVKHTPDADPDIPPAKRHGVENDEGDDDSTIDEEADKENNTRIDVFAEQTNSNSSGRSNEDVDEDEDEVAEESASSTSTESEQNTAPSTQPEEEEPTAESSSAQSDEDRVDWSDISRIGEKTAENLYEHGFETVGDVRSASDSELFDVPLLGGSGIENLREYIDE
jgi:predicted flap endonuclease-1-like 5' DNA nuclease